MIQIKEYIDAVQRNKCIRTIIFMYNCSASIDA